MKFQAPLSVRNLLLINLLTGILAHAPGRHPFHGSSSDVVRIVQLELSFIDIYNHNRRELYQNISGITSRPITASRLHPEEVSRDYIFERASSMSPVDFWNHPVRLYHLVKRLVLGWSEVRTWIVDNVDRIRFENELDVDLDTLPDDEVLKMAAQTIMRSAYVYDLNLDLLIGGSVLGVTAGESLRIDDILLIAKTAGVRSFHDVAVIWLLRGLAKCPNETERCTDALEQDLLEHLQWAYFQDGQVNRAITVARTLLSKHPGNARVRHNVRYYLNLGPGQLHENRDRPTQSSESYDRYRKCCQGDYRSRDRPLKIVRQLICRYSTNNNEPRLILKPAKEEVLNPEPFPVVFYHDVLSDRQIATIQNKVESRMEASVMSRDSAREKSLNDSLDNFVYRSGKTAWLENSEDDVLRKLDQLIQDVTGLDMNYSEHYQILDYGIAGHYEPHTDPLTVKVHTRKGKISLWTRYATFLVYMNDVRSGGYTAFPDLKLHAIPEKGGALLWYNVDRNGGLKEESVSKCHNIIMPYMK